MRIFFSLLYYDRTTTRKYDSLHKRTDKFIRYSQQCYRFTNSIRSRFKTITILYYNKNVSKYTSQNDRKVSADTNILDNMAYRDYLHRFRTNLDKIRVLTNYSNVWNARQCGMYSNLSIIARKDRDKVITPIPYRFDLYMKYINRAIWNRYYVCFDR